MGRRLLLLLAGAGALTLTIVGIGVARKIGPHEPSSSNIASSKAEAKRPGVSGEPLPVVVPTVDPGDRERAEAAALAYEETRRRTAGKRFRVVAAEYYGSFGAEDKIEATDPCATRSCLKVTVFNYTDNVSLVVFVEKGTWKALALRELRGGPTLSRAELEAAHAIADGDSEVRGLTGPSHQHPRPPHHASQRAGMGPCAVERCAAVFYTLSDGRILVVLVSLNNESVVARIFP